MTGRVQAEGLTKWYGKVTALSKLSMDLGPGVWSVLGPNGSGKTTFMRLVAGLTRPNLGTVTVCGHTPFANPHAAAHLGHCPESDTLYNMSGLEFVTQMAMLSGVPKQEAKDRAVAALETFRMTDRMETPISTYSRGMRQRTKLAQAIAHDPGVLLLDEPLTGTDPALRHLILDEVKRRADAGTVVLFSTHVLSEVETITTKMMLLARGQLIAHGSVPEIRALLQTHPHHVHVECDNARRFAASLVQVEGIRTLSIGNEVVEVLSLDPDLTYDGILDAALHAKVNIKAITSPDSNLEALFHSLVEFASRGAGTGADAGSRAPRELAEASGYKSQLATQFEASSRSNGGMK